MSDRHDRYIRGLCIDCGKRRHSPGRPRCDACHRAYETAITTGKVRM